MSKDEDILIVTRRSMKERAWVGVFAACWLVVSCWIVQGCWPLHNPADVSAIIGILALLGVGQVLWLLGAGPRELYCDVRQGRYTVVRGFPLFSWKYHGPLTGSEFYIYYTKSELFQIRFLGYGARVAMALRSFDTDEEARTEAWRIANTLDLTVRARDAPPLGAIESIKRTKR